MLIYINKLKVILWIYYNKIYIYILIIRIMNSMIFFYFFGTNNKKNVLEYKRKGWKHLNNLTNYKKKKNKYKYNVWNDN